MEEVKKEFATVSEYNRESLVSEVQRTTAILSEGKEKEINHNKPWRIVIRRNVIYGGGSNENIS